MTKPQPVHQQPREHAPRPTERYPAPVPDSSYQPCAECGAPLERQQRYCLNCGARRGDAANPASRYLVAATRRRRATAVDTPPRRTQGSGARVAAVGFFALLPLAVAIGVLVGRSGSNTNDADLLKALRDNGTTAAALGAGTKVSDASSKLLPSDFSLDRGYTVKLSLLPIKSTDRAAASKAESDAKSKGARHVGIINPRDFTTTPDQGQMDYVLYSGEYKQKGEAQKVLTGLEKHFPDAEVIAVASASATESSPSGTKVVAQTSHGAIHRVAGLNPSQKQIEKGTKTVSRIARQTGKSYIQQQRNLPNIIPIGGDGGNPPPLPTGGGD